MGHQEDIVKTESKIIVIRDTQVILDRDVAELYGVTTRDINKAVKNNPTKFPFGYIIELTASEKGELVENFHRFNPLKHSTVLPHAFTEQGLYMLATILKSPLATQTTITIIDTFTKLRKLARAMEHANETMAQGGAAPSMQEQKKFQNMMNEVFANNLPIKMQKMTFGVNLGFFKWSMETTKDADKGEKDA